MHSFLIAGGDQAKRGQWIANKLTQWRIGKFDVIDLVTEEATIGIASVREFQKKLLLKPLSSPLTVGVIRHAETLTVEAQNALLKTLEEPPPHARVILEAQTADFFLPTVLSRCQLINIDTRSQYVDDVMFQCFKTIEQIMAAPMGKRLKLVDSIAKNKEEAAAWIDLAISSTRHALLTSELRSHEAAKLLRALLLARQYLAANVNYKLVLDNIFLYNGH